MLQTENPFELPPFYCPLPNAMSPFADAAQQTLLEWLDSTDLEREHPGSRDIAINTKMHREWGFCASAAVDEEVFQLVTNFGAWYFVIDDMHFSPDADMRHSAEVVGQVMRAFSAPGYRPPESDDVCVSALHGVLEQLRARCHPTLYSRFTHDMRRFFLGTLRKQAARQAASPLSEDHYLAVRVDDVGAYTTWPGLEMSSRVVVPDEEIYAPAAQAFLESANLVIALDNDVYSYRKELDDPTEINFVKAIRHNRNLSLEDAVAETIIVRDRIYLLFLRLYEKLRPSASTAMRGLLDQIAYTHRGHILEALSGIPRYLHNLAPADIPWASEPATNDTSPLPYPNIAWWWNHA